MYITETQLTFCWLHNIVTPHLGGITIFHIIFIKKRKRKKKRTRYKLHSVKVKHKNHKHAPPPFPNPTWTTLPVAPLWDGSQQTLNACNIVVAFPLSLVSSPAMVSAQRSLISWNSTVFFSFFFSPHMKVVVIWFLSPQECVARLQHLHIIDTMC